MLPFSFIDVIKAFFHDTENVIDHFFVQCLVKTSHFFFLSVEYHANPEEPQEPEEPPADEWEVNPNNVTFLEELGQGAFGKVFKAIIKEPPQRQETIIMARLMGTPQVIKRKKNEEIAAIKTLHGELV